MKNLGKRFEENFKKSIIDDENTLLYRFKDGTANFGGERNTNVRFQASNVCDFMLFHSYEYNSKLFLIELKSHKGKSLPITCIRDNQIKEMTTYSKKKNVESLLIVNFSDIDRCFSISIDQFNEFIKLGERKSIPLSYFEEYGIEIDIIKLKVNNKYNIYNWLEKF